MSAGGYGSRLGGRDDGGEYLSPSFVILAARSLQDGVEPFAKPIAVILADLMGIAPSFVLRAKEEAPPILRTSLIRRARSTAVTGIRPCLAAVAIPRLKRGSIG